MLIFKANPAFSPTLYHDSLPDSNICSLFPKRKGPVSGTLSLQEEMIVNQ